MTFGQLSLHGYIKEFNRRFDSSKESPILSRMCFLFPLQSEFTKEHVFKSIIDRYYNTYIYAANVLNYVASRKFVSPALQSQENWIPNSFLRFFATFVDIGVVTAILVFLILFQCWFSDRYLHCPLSVHFLSYFYICQVPVLFSFPFEFNSLYHSIVSNHTSVDFRKDWHLKLPRNSCRFAQRTDGTSEFNSLENVVLLTHFYKQYYFGKHCKLNIGRNRSIGRIVSKTFLMTELYC